ncbi:pericentrin-like isoform X3 [Homalodisca vitripennis]|nr:pericentrin-like isoform X3 [Homalodisca vitripennis]
MDAITLQKKTTHVDSLNTTIKNLQDSLSEKNEIIESLEITNRVLREGTGDHIRSAQAVNSQKMTLDLQKQVDSRDTYIVQLSDSLKQRSQEVTDLLLKEKELNVEIESLQKQIKLNEKQSEMKLSDFYNEAIEYRAKVELLSSQNQEYIDMVHSLKTALDTSSKKIDSQKEELVLKNQKLEKYKNEASEDIKTLMRQVEELNHDVSNKEVEMLKNRAEIEQLRNQQEEQIRSQLIALKNELEKKYAEDVRKVELLYDGMLLEHIRKSEADLKAVSNTEELEALKLSYQEQMNAYKEDLNNLLEKSKLNEEQLSCELEKHKQDADYYRQQVENVENKLAEEIQRIKHECYLELSKYETEMKMDFDAKKIQYYKEEIDTLSARLKEYALNEAKKDVETETYRIELEKVEDDMTSVIDKLSKYKDAYENQMEHTKQLENKLDQLRELNLQLQASLQEFKKNEGQLVHELKMKQAKLLEYEQKAYDFNEKIQFESNQIGQKYQVVIATFKEQIQNLVGELERNKQFYEEDLSCLTSKTCEQEKEIKHLKGKITHMMRNGKIYDEIQQIDTNLKSYSQVEQLNILKEKVARAEYFNESNKGLFQSILSGLKNIKTGLQTIVYGSIEDSPELEQTQSGDVDECEMVLQDLEQTMHDLQHMVQSGSIMLGPTHQPSMVTSTPNNNETVKSWMRKCASLENENEQLTKELELLSANLKEMEHCLLVATQESSSFNKKCQSLDAKITELENSKLSEFMLKKENNELKERLSYMELAEDRFHKELEALHENNIKLEQKLHKNILDIQNKIAKSGTNKELENILSNLKAKSEEVITLKSQLVQLQKSEKELKSKIYEIQSKYDKFVAQYEFLTSELDVKNKELEDVWEERNKLSTENKLLNAKLSSVQDKHPLQNLMKSDASRSESINEVSNDGRDTKSFKDRSRELESLNNLSLRRLQTMRILTSTPNLSDKLNTLLPKTSSVAEQIGYQLELLDQQLKDSAYYMPTIPEEEDQEEGNLAPQQTGLSNDPQIIRRGGLVYCRSGLALRQLLSVLFDEYTSCIKNLLLPWKEECETLDFNLHKYLDINSSNNSPIQVDQTDQVGDKEGNHEERRDLSGDMGARLQNTDFLKKITEDCVKSMFHLSRRLVTAHNAVLTTIGVQREQVETGCQLVELQELVRSLQAEKLELEKKHKSAIELLIKDHENELVLVNNLLAKVQKEEPLALGGDWDIKRRELEQKHRREVEDLRTYFEKKCADLEKHYSEEIYSQSQQSCKVSEGSCSSDIGNMVDLYDTGLDEHNHLNNDEKLHERCEKKIEELKEELKTLQERCKTDVESLSSQYPDEFICKLCRKKLTAYRKDEYGQPGDNSCDLDSDLDLKVYQIKEEVRKDYETEIEKIKEDIIEQVLKSKDEEIEVIRSQLNKKHKMEVEKFQLRYDEMAKREVENSALLVKNEVFMSHELKEKTKHNEQLKRKLKVLSEQKENEMEKLKSELVKAHKKEVENMKQAFEIEMTTRIGAILEEKTDMEDKFRKQVEKMQKSIMELHLEKDHWQACQDQELQQLTDKIRKDILRVLESQIKAMVASGDEGDDKSQWPPELVALERQFTSKYQHQMAQLVEEHALEIADIKAECDAKLSEVVKMYSIKQAEEMPLTLISTGDEDLDKIIRERDSLRSLALTLHRVVKELAQYLTSCEDELNKSVVGELLKMASPHLTSTVHTSDVEASSDSESESHNDQRRVHFAPDVSALVSLLEDDCLENTSVDVSLQLRAELESCLERLRGEAAIVLGLTQGRATSTMEDRRLTSLTRQLIEEKKAKEEALIHLEELQDQVQKYESELKDLHKNLVETKDKMIKEKIAEEVELRQRHADARVHKLSLLQEKARTLLSERGDCPPQWLGLIEELCVEGDCLIEEAWRVRDEQQLEVEAADKQLRSTRAFLDEQALEREQERDEYTRQIARLNELVRERGRDRQFSSELPSPLQGCDTNTRNSAASVESLEQQLKEMTERLSDSEDKKLKMEKKLKGAEDKIWVLQDYIDEIETTKSQREAALEERVVELQAELDTQARAHAEVVGELQSLQGCSGDHTPQPSPQTHICPPTSLQLKSQLRGMAKSLEKQIRELEAANIHVSSASLSSPSEDVSIREQLEALRCRTPEDSSCPNSPSHLPMEELVQLSDKLLRYSRAAENIIKKLRDREMETLMLRANAEEMQAERDVLQGQNERQQLQLATLNKRVEELRVRNEREIQASAAPLHQRILELETLCSDLGNELKEANRKLAKTKQKLDRTEAVMLRQEGEISSLSQHQQELVNNLSTDLAAMKAEKQQLQIMVEKYRSEDSVSFPQLIEVMLAEKNADIDQLQHRVEELQLQQENSSKSQSKSKSCRVSFADEVSYSRLTDGERAREAPQESNSIKPFFSTPLSTIEEGNRLVPRVIGEDISKIPVHSDINFNSSPNRASQLESVLSQLKEELEQKSQRLLECEAQLKELPTLEEELRRTKEEFVETVKSVGEDKKFYEEQLGILRETKEQLAERERELKEVRIELQQKEEDMVRTTADVKALQRIMEGLQQKLREAKTFTQTGEDSESAENKYKNECDELKSAVFTLKAQVSSLEKILENEKMSNKSLQEKIDKLKIEKENILLELNTTKSNSVSIQVELEKAMLSSKEKMDMIESLRSDLEVSSKEKSSLNLKCQKLKKELEQLTRKQKVELKNILQKDHEEAQKVKEELESLKSSNSELQSACEKLQQELSEVGSNLELLRELNVKDEKIEELQAELTKLDQDKQVLRDEKLKTEQCLNKEISELKVLIEDLNKNSLQTVEIEQVNMKDRESLMRKYEVLKREYERLRRARRECEKKCLVLKDELTKEKQYSARLQGLTGGKRVPQLQVSKSNLVDIRPDGMKMTKSLDNLADEVQKELNTSAQLDQSLITDLQNNTETGVEVVRSDNMAPHVDYLSARLAEAETAFHVERVVVNELRARLVEEHQRLMEERARTLELQEEVATLHTLNDQFEDKFKNIVSQLEQQVNEVKELRHNMQPTDTNVIEKEKLKKLVEENQRRVDELLQERVFNKNQLLYLREELAKLQQEREEEVESRRQSNGDNRLRAAMINLQQALESRTSELEQERKRCASLQKIVEQVNSQNNQHAENLVLMKNLQSVENLRKALECRTHELELEKRRCEELERMMQQANLDSSRPSDEQSTEVEYLRRKIVGEERLRKKLEEKIAHMELAQGSRLSRRRETEEKLRESLAQAEKVKKDLEKECMGLQLKLKQCQIQLSAQAGESPVSLRLKEANMALERLVKDKEDLNTANALLIEEKQQLQIKLRDQDSLIEDLKSRIHALNIKVTDGGMDNVNALFAAERAAWLKEKEALKEALTKTHAATQSVNSDSFTSYSNSAHVLQRYLRAESHRKALVWQKRYLLVALKGYQDHSKQTVASLLARLPTLPPPPPPSPEHRFKVAVCAVRAVYRMQYLVNHRKQAHENTRRLLQHALNNMKPRRGESVAGAQNVWRKAEGMSSNPIQPGNLSHYLDRFNSLQDRIKNTLSTEKTEY